MNAHMRRYLDEDWDEEPEEPRAKQPQKPPRRAQSQARRQEQKDWGRAIAKHLRQLQKQRGTNGKP
jgi:hypothetical protein